MKLHGFTCGWCDKYHSTIHGAHKSDGSLTVRCDVCGTVERVRGPSKTVWERGSA